MQKVRPRSVASEEVEANKAILHSAMSNFFSPGISLFLDHESTMSNFFSPATIVRPRRAGRRVMSWRDMEEGEGEGGQKSGGGRGQRRQEKSGSLTSWEEAAALAETCYTHTVLLAGQCWVLCDHVLVAPCSQQKYKR